MKRFLSSSNSSAIVFIFYFIVELQLSDRIKDYLVCFNVILRKAIQYIKLHKKIHYINNRILNKIVFVAINKQPIDHYAAIVKLIEFFLQSL